MSRERGAMQARDGFVRDDENAVGRRKRRNEFAGARKQIGAGVNVVAAGGEIDVDGVHDVIGPLPLAGGVGERAPNGGAVSAAEGAPICRAPHDTL
jgi:hypothetical protein